MSVRSEPTTAESRNTLLLYCPFDRKVTRHARRGPENQLVCVDCGRRLDAAGNAAPRSEALGLHAQVTAPMKAVQTHRGHELSTRSRRAAIPWLGIVLATVVALVGLFGLINVAIRVASPTGTEIASPPPVANPSAAMTAVFVANTEGIGAYMRATPNLDDRMTAWPDDTQLTIIGADVNAGGLLWKHVQDPDGNQGWIPAQYTRP
ncbi:MAG: hypothetical protein HW416_698 [Chloroflexi bacterium]|nr:hypothetical protein [Chloroflexota bacterium]